MSGKNKWGGLGVVANDGEIAERRVMDCYVVGEVQTLWLW